MALIMDRSLKPEQTYQLSTKEELHETKELYFVKLTDSSLRAVEEYLEHKAAVKGHPKIQFFGKNGVIHIPSRPGSASQDIGKKFKFSCSNFAQDSRQGITDCIQQPNSKDNRLSSMGMVEKKIAVMANDEAYEMTRNKMAQADQERKEVRTKEIKLNHSKSKKKKPPLIKPVGKELNSAIKKKLTTPGMVKPLNGTKGAAINGSSSMKGTSYKDRVIHILALRPHKKPEILSRLQREGINQRDKNSLGAILQQVATMQDNSFRLNKRYYVDVKPDTWPYYNESERTSVKQSLSQHCAQESSPKVSSTSKSPEDKGVKRHLNSDYNHSQAKKPRIAKPLQDPLTSSSNPSKVSSNGHNQELKTSPLNQRIQPLKTKSEHLQNKPELSRNKHGHGNEKTELKPKTELKNERITPINSLECGGKEDRPNVKNKNERSPQEVASTSDIPEHVLKYQPIKSYDQRCKYKQDFQAQYKEYRELKGNVDSVSMKFSELDRLRRKYPDDSEEAQKIKQRICDLYEEHQKDSKFRVMKQRCQELHAKLSHIKKLVVEYDQNNSKSIS
eukprot:Seg577.1 transcript_id=Seg577.1/GoldUCD/mRNA.D3Y31 product="RNA polymerase II elongation factor ELL" protein_id=Seg577.1/GoldUCD/D3Y31